MAADLDVVAFTSWFCARGGHIDESIRIGIVPDSNPDSAVSAGGSSGMGAAGVRGVLATRDIPPSHTLLTIPRALTLSARTSALPGLFGTTRWRECALHRGWAGLILCMMWEAARTGEASEGWRPYFDIMPTTFDTPMFWSPDELAELAGTSVLDKIGREDAEEEYTNKILPAVQSRPDLFSPSLLESHYSLATFHIMGSRILSRSFQVERVEGEDEDNGEGEGDGEGAQEHEGSSMDVDVPEVLQSDEHPSGHSVDHQTEIEDEDGDDDDGTDITMVPMADMLNAQYESENAKLFYTPRSLNMVSTKFIPAGSQVWNTYGDLPNAELLRRYGHVDLLPLAPAESEGSAEGGESNTTRLGNPADVVEVRADLAVAVVLERTQKTKMDIDERVEWWLDEGGDEFTLPTSDNTALPPPLLSFILLLLLPAVKWDSTRTRGKPPKPKLHGHANDGEAAEAREVLEMCKEVLQRRGQAYPASLEGDERALVGASAQGLGARMRNALVVRVGEQRALEAAVRAVQGALTRLDAEKEGRAAAVHGGRSSGREGKRERDGAGGRTGARAKKARK